MPKQNGQHARSSEAPAKVFINLPYDQAFERLYLAYIVGISALGMVPKATLEIAGTVRIDRIWSLITQCRYSVHDLSRVQLDRNRPSTPRFNMPFELGLAVAYKQASSNEHDWFVFETKERRIMKSLSDLNGTDVYIHGGVIRGVFRQLCNAFVRPGIQPTVPQMLAIYRKLGEAIPQIKREAGSTTLFEARPFRELCFTASALADEIVLPG